MTDQSDSHTTAQSATHLPAIQRSGRCGLPHGGYPGTGLPHDAPRLWRCAPVGPSSKAFKQAYDSGRIVRLHLMRGTWQLVASEDYWPLLQPVCPQGKGGDSRVDAERAVSVSGRMRRPAYVNSWSKRLPTRVALSKKILSGRWMPKASAWMITACLTTCAWLSCRAPCAAVIYCP